MPLPRSPHRHRAGPRRAATLAAGLLAIVTGLLATPAGRAADVPATPAAGAAPRPIPAYRRAEHVAVLTIRGEIGPLTLRSLERRMAEVREIGADAVVLELDTPGGRLDVTLDITNLLKDRSETPANVVAWVRPDAYSAGTIIALATREIIVAPNATFGDAAPIQGMPLVGLVQMPAAERAKVEAPLRGEVRDSARRNHYDENLVLSFVSVGMELWLLENASTGERVVVDAEEYRAVFGDDPPQEIANAAPSGGQVASPRYNELFDRAEEAAAGAADPALEVEFMQQLPPSRAPLTEADRGDWRLVTQIVSDDELLVLKPDEARLYGLAQDVIANDAELLAWFGASRITRLDRSWSERLVAVMISLPVRIVLIILFIVGLLIEMAAPGVGAFGGLALLSLLILIGAPYLAGMAQWWEILAIGLGLLLILAEVLVIPGTGIAGISGVALLLAGIVGTFVTGDLSSPAGRQELWSGVLATFTGLFGAGVAAWLLSRHVHSVPMLERLILATELTGTSQDDGGSLLAAAAPSAVGGTAGHAAVAVGDAGTAITDLRPSGRASFDGETLDVQSTGSYIESGTAVRVVNVGKYVIEVEKA